MFKKVLITSFVLILNLAAFRTQAQVQNEAQDEASQKEYRIAVNNKLDITVYGEADLCVSLRVSKDGTINYPLLGNIKAEGMTARELERQIETLLEADYLVNPQVSVSVVEFAKFSLLGQVRNPGSYEMKENLTLTQAIASAGGFTDTADTTKVKIIHSKGDSKETVEVNIDKILSKEVPDIEISSNDTIIVEEYGRISIMGQVARAGVYTLRKGLTVMQAISLAGGFGPTAAANETKVIRIEDGEKKIIKVPVLSIMKGGDASSDILLKDGDTIIIPESFF